jgi:hypothetical protein
MSADEEIGKEIGRLLIILGVIVVAAIALAVYVGHHIRWAS